MKLTATVTVYPYRKDRKGRMRYRISISEPGKKRQRIAGGYRQEADALASRIRLEGLEAVLGLRSRRPMTLAELRDLQLARDAEKASVAADAARWPKILTTKGSDGRVILPETTIVDSVRPSDVVRFRASLAATTTRRGRPPAPATINRCLALLSRAYTIAIEERAARENPVKRDLYLVEDNARHRVATKDEVRALLDAASPEMRLAILIARCSTLRQGTIAALKWSAIDLDRRTVVIEKRKRTRLARQSRPIPLLIGLSKRAAHALCEHLDLPATKARIATGDLYVFTLSAGAISSAFGDLTARCGIVNLTFHDLRHTATTELSGEGRLNTRELERTGDWAPGSVMLRRYDHPDMARVLAALDAIDDA